MTNDITLTLDTSRWPESASLTQWSRIIPKRYNTLLKHRRQGHLPGVRQLDGSLRVSKATMVACFGLSKAKAHQKRKQLARNSCWQS